MYLRYSSFAEPLQPGNLLECHAIVVVMSQDCPVAIRQVIQTGTKRGAHSIPRHAFVRVGRHGGFFILIKVRSLQHEAYRQPNSNFNKSL